MVCVVGSLLVSYTMDVVYDFENLKRDISFPITSHFLFDLTEKFKWPDNLRVGAVLLNLFITSYIFS